MVLAVRSMSGGHENGGIPFGFASPGFIWHIEESCHINSRKAFKDQLFNVKAVHWKAAGDLGAQWRPDRWQSAHHQQKFPPQFALQTQQVRFRPNAAPS